MIQGDIGAGLGFLTSAGILEAMLVALICTRLVIFAGSSSQAVGLDILKLSFMPISFTDLPIGICRHNTP